jgi:hypothetical protein
MQGGFWKVEMGKTTSVLVELLLVVRLETQPRSAATSARMSPRMSLGA